MPVVSASFGSRSLVRLVPLLASAALVSSLNSTAYASPVEYFSALTVNPGDPKKLVLGFESGLAGLLVDLRDIPLRLPERADRRRDLLAAWQQALWAGADL